jgi:hypothetical protein
MLRNAFSRPAAASGQMIGEKIDEIRSMKRLKRLPCGAGSSSVWASPVSFVILPSSA